MAKSVPVTVTTSPTLLTVTETDYVGGASVGLTLPLATSSSVVVYVGGSDVAASGATKGTEMSVSRSVTVALDKGETLYGVVPSGTQVVDVLHQGVGV